MLEFINFKFSRSRTEWMKIFRYIIFLFIVVSTAALAQPVNITPAILQQLQNISQLPVDQKAPIFHQMIPQLNQITNPQGMRLVTETARMMFVSERAWLNLSRAYNELNNFKEKYTIQNAKKTITILLRSLAMLHHILPKIPSQYHKTALTLNTLKKSGFDWDRYFGEQFVTTNPHMQSLIDDLVNHIQVPATEAELEKKDKENIQQFVDNIVSFIPARYASTLTGPTRQHFMIIINYDRKLWRESKQGIDLVVDAMQNGQVDTQRLAQITNNLNNLAKQSPWDLQSTQDYLRKLGSTIPGLDKVINALFSDKMKMKKTGCAAINCDCDNLKVDIIDRPYRKVCRSTEAKLRKQCEITGKVTGRCHPTASGPNAWPR